MSFSALTDVFPGLRRRRVPAPRLPLPPYVPVEEPPHSEACYCAVAHVDLLPCGNCRREVGATKGGAS